MIRWLFRPSLLVVVSVVLTLAAGAVLFWPLVAGPANRAVARPVPAGDQEIAWLNPATNAVAWERFVAAVQRLKTDRPELNLQVFVDAAAFPAQTADVPELSVSAGPGGRRLWIRWYKLTADLGHRQWVQALAQRRPTPLAIIGGGSSDRAQDLATVLNEDQQQFPSPPLFLISTASLEENLMSLYAGRTYRFCFTNRQIAEAVSDFLWQQDDLRPDSAPVYMVRWEDDPYSGDLANEFRRSMGPDAPPRPVGPPNASSGDTFYRRLQGADAVRRFARHWAWWGGRAGAGSLIDANLAELLPDRVNPPGPFWSSTVPYSVGSFNQPNHWEEGAAEKLMNALDQHPEQQRPLLVLPAAPQPARRFLRALLTMSPLDARRFVVATGDAVDFNTIYRDRNTSWPIQNLPVPLVFFCQRNPVDPSAFRPDPPGGDTQPPDPSGPTSTGTQDLLLYRDLMATVVEAAFVDGNLLDSPDALGERFRAMKLKDGRSRFTRRGNQHGGTGEFVVCLRPVRVGDRFLPQARLQVWNRSDTDGPGRKWVRVPVAGRAELLVDYVPGTGG